MAKKMMKIWTMLLVLALCVSVIPVYASAASDDSQTHIYYKEEGDKAPFTKEDIVITMDGNDYNFSSSGNNSWTNSSPVGELKIPEGESKKVEITVGEDKYDATLSNHADTNSNNNNGTDTFDITGITKKNPPSPPTEPSQPTEPTTPPAPPAPRANPQPRVENQPQPDVTADVVEIPDGDVPLADTPKTGDISGILAALSSLSAGGLLVLNRKKKED